MTVVPILSYVFTKAEFITCYNSCHSDGTIDFLFSSGHIAKQP